jgi:hypothetical protein
MLGESTMVILLNDPGNADVDTAYQAEPQRRGPFGGILLPADPSKMPTNDR